MRRFRFRPLILRCRKCEHRWKPTGMGIRQKCPKCEQARVEMEESQDAAEADEDLEDDSAGGELIDARQWTDSTGRTMNATLRTVMKDAAGYFIGFFVREDGIGFQYQIGKLSSADIAMVKQTMIEKDLYDPDDMA